MSSYSNLAYAWIAGLLLGIVFLGGLWWTVQKGLVSNNPALWFLGSFLLRAALVLVGFYFVSQGPWESLSACLLGFLCARIFVVRGLARMLLRERTELVKENPLAS
ncbi:ATP synthase subunit I [Telmatocola sphagniphila]|uniref:ATP synthase subunit I n=1 Tax=Telmatocola sphagniphila TaxID=1123043 RepID=A0A8E6B8Y2_9BACT|nr:ATP synthase subunit I [Telmatocola sphagniphila]QVL34078.1 ATP synthase subunit I [Telmatocola sphagniphila]